MQHTVVRDSARPAGARPAPGWPRATVPASGATPPPAPVIDPAPVPVSGPAPVAAAGLARVPASVEETGLDPSFIADLALKVIYFSDQVTAAVVSERLGLRYGNVLEPVLALLRREHLVETTPRDTRGELGYAYSITEKGTARVLQVMERNAYVGPAPVPLAHYAAVVAAQAVSERRVSPEQVRDAMADLVLEERTVRAIGRAVNTGRSLFLFGPPGNGKTVLAEHTIPLLGGHVLVPHAIVVDGLVIKVYDPPNHRPVAPAGGSPNSDLDPRYVLCERPAIVVGGELGLDALDLVYDPASKVYEAPLQMKANGGVFLIDDFGRQLVTPRELLNRWIVPLEKRVDFLTLRTGKKIEVPFDQLIVFSTNLAPKDLVDEAFLRRIQNKIFVGDPTPEAFCEIVRRQCLELGVDFDPDGLVHLLRAHYAGTGRPFRACHPRDLLRVMVGMARFDGVPPTLSPDLIDQACETYFVDV